LKKVVLFNKYHNGDIHVSRGFIRQIMNKVAHQIPDASFFYTHRNSPYLLSDIPNLTFDANLINNINEHDNLVRIDNIVYINTWYAQQHQKYLRQYGITFDSLYSAFNDTCKQLWNFSLDEISTNISEFFPNIEYSKFNVNHIQNWLNSDINKKVLIENCYAKSNQSFNLPIASIIAELAKHYTNITFILSNKENIILPSNVIYADDIIKNSNNNLNEISFISTYCDLIIGKASGVFTFTLTQENLFRRNTKYLCFSNLIPNASGKFWIGPLLKDKVNYSAKFTVANVGDIYTMRNLINNSLRELQ
jgi:hypothetical protein